MFIPQGILCNLVVRNSGYKASSQACREDDYLGVEVDGMSITMAKYSSYKPVNPSTQKQVKSMEPQGT